ncbi:unnamed protein product [Linum tenue]|uniref:C2H2-type domain-containing protein n=1 Tax=Linum tenue TaxID=586396 RepID=A0AAV0IR64_9ROSI|nr:unnamed protein product [Linum tenue]
MFPNLSSSPPSSLETETAAAAAAASPSNKRKRRPAGTPDPDAEVVSLSPRTLMESDRYVCEICNQGFQRDQNLQMHRRRHKVPWKLLKRETPVVKKRVFVCPEPSCLHHDPCHALGDLVGIKKHFRRKHSNTKQWVCDKCSKGYAVQSDYKAHLKTCGTRGHSCDCGRVFSRVESFIEHQDACSMGRQQHSPPDLHQHHQQQQHQTACLSRTASSPSPSNETAPWPMIAPTRPSHPSQQQQQLALEQQLTPPPPPPPPPPGHHHRGRGLMLLSSTTTTSTATTTTTTIGAPTTPTSHSFHNLDLQLSSPSSSAPAAAATTQLQLSVGSSSCSAGRREVKEEIMRAAMAEKAYAEEVRKEAKRQIQLAEEEFANAKRIRQRAQAELDKAEALKEHAVKQMSSAVLHLTCATCRNKFAAAVAPPDENSLVVSYVSSGVTDHGEVEKGRSEG